MFLEDSSARVCMLDRSTIVVDGVQLFLAPWLSEVNTFEDFLLRKARTVGACV